MAPERVSDYPRPPRLEPSEEHIGVLALGQTLAQTNRNLWVRKTYGTRADAFRAEDKLTRESRGDKKCMNASNAEGRNRREPEREEAMSIK